MLTDYVNMEQMKNALIATLHVLDENWKNIESQQNYEL